MILKRSLNKIRSATSQLHLRLLGLLIICALPYQLMAQGFDQHAVSNGASLVSGGNYTGYVSAGQMITHFNITGNPKSTSGIILNQFSVTPIAGIVVTPDSYKNINCFNGTEGEISVTVTGGTPPYLYSWVRENDAVFTSSDEDLTGLAAGKYFLTVTDAASETNSNFNMVLTEPNLLEVTATGSDVLCFGGSTGTATANVTGGTPPFNYLWSNGEISQTISGLPVGTYNVTVTDDNGCIAAGSFVVAQPSAVRPNATAIDITCFGSADGIIDLSKAGGGVPPYHYKLDNGSYQTVSSFSNLTAGIYTVSVLDNNGCEGSETVTINEPPLLEIGLTSSTSTCQGTSNGSINITVSGGTGKYSYNWTLPNGTTSVKEDLSGIGAGSYTVTVTDANGCSQTQSFVIDVVPPPVVTGITNHVLCNNTATGSIDITVAGTGPFTFLWSGTGVRGVTTEDVSNLVAGNYSVTVTNFGGCSTSASFTVTEPAALSFSTVKTDITGCGGTGSITFTVAGGTQPYSYSVDNGVSYSFSNEIQGLAAGNFSVKVKDANGCELAGTKAVSILDTGSDSFEPNKSLTTSATISTGQSISARISPAREVDWYKIVTSTAGSYSLTLNHTLAYAFDIWISSKTKLNPASVSGSTKTYNLLANTTYYILVTGGAANLWSNVCYSMLVDGPPALTAQEAFVKSANVESNSAFGNEKPLTLDALVYPNPHNGTFILSINSPKSGLAEIEMFNVNGQVVDNRKTELVEGNSNRIEYRSMNYSVLFYRINIDGKTKVGKIISNQ